MWGRAVVVENEMMFHRGDACGPSALRRPAGLDITSLFGADPESEDGWRITTAERVIQRVPAEEMRFLVHWGAQLFMDDEELKVSLDHTDDITRERALDMLIADLRARGAKFEEPSDPMNDRTFVRVLSQVYDVGTPSILPPEPAEEPVAA
jgi:hypothetical protein